LLLGLLDAVGGLLDPRDLLHHAAVGALLQHHPERVHGRLDVQRRACHLGLVDDRVRVLTLLDQEQDGRVLGLNLVEALEVTAELRVGGAHHAMRGDG
jgi:hypothetical protein